MRKLLLVSVVLLASTICFGQSLDFDFNEYSKHIDSSGIYLQKASDDMAYGLIFGTVGVGLGIGLDLFINDDETKEQSKIPVYLMAGGGAIYLGCFIAAIVHTNKAGKHLRKANMFYQKSQQKVYLNIQSNRDGVGLALKF